MKPMICFLLLDLGACGGQQKTGTPLAAETDTIRVKEPDKEPIILERETGKPVYDMIEGDTVYRYADSGPEFSIPKPTSTSAKASLWSILWSIKWDYLVTSPLQGRQKYLRLMPVHTAKWIPLLARWSATCLTSSLPALTGAGQPSDRSSGKV